VRNPEEILERLKHAEEDPGPIQDLGVRFVGHDIPEGWVRAEMDPQPRHRNMGGGVHGGVLASLADIVAGLGVVCSIGVEDWTTTTELNISYLRRMKRAPLTIEARALHRGLRTQVWGVEIQDAAGRRMAEARLRFLVNAGGRV
jgi:uncharacterized protein (TIGR00369 family)